MKTNRYLIKATYLNGPHAGKIYLLRKGGYVTDIRQYQWDDTTYASKGIAQRICNKMKSDNDLDFSIERHDDEFNIKRGRHAKEEWEFIYWLQSYEPIQVDSVTDQVALSELTEEELFQLEADLRWSR